MESVDAVVVGAGVVGLAIARELALAGREVIILDAEDAIGTHTSSRNSEVIHAGIYYPTRGQVHSSGKISALLDVAVGVNPEATGRENIILRGMYMDIHPHDMREHVNEIAEFTELGPYLDLAGCEGPARETALGLAPQGQEAYAARLGWYLLERR